MKINYFFILAGFLAGCAGAEKPKEPLTTLRGDLVQPPVSQQASATTKLLYNPAHGEPGHTCALPVGAPLSNQSASAAPVQTTALPDPSVLPPIDPNNSRLNPEHGKPGHRCDIPVGQPLNKKPAATTQTAQVVTQPTKAGMNPPHGQPNHRCDIAVGAPLSTITNSPDSAAAKVPNAGN